MELVGVNLWDVLGAILPLLRPWGLIFRALGESFCAHFSSLGAILGAFGGHFGSLGGSFGGLWAVLGRLFGALAQRTPLL